MTRFAKAGLVFIALIAFLVVIAHMSCIWLGPQCFIAQMAPPSIVKSAELGTWFAPIGTALVSSLFFVCALYALSAAQIIRKLPLLKLAVFVISSLCMIRGILVIPLLFLYPEANTGFAISAGALWFLCGLLLLTCSKHLKSIS